MSATIMKVHYDDFSTHESPADLPSDDGSHELSNTDQRESGGSDGTDKHQGQRYIRVEDL